MVRFRRISTERSIAPTVLYSESESPPCSPTQAHAQAGRIRQSFYQHPSGSRFTEDEVSAVFSSEAASDATSGAHSIRAWNDPAVGLRTQPTRLQKPRRAPQPPPRPPPLPPPPPSPSALADQTVADSESEVTTTNSSSTWTMASVPSMSPAPQLPISFSPASHPAESFTEYDRLHVRSGETPSLVLLRAVLAASDAEKPQLRNSRLVHTSLPSGRDAIRDIIPRRNGFVDTVIEAYNSHRGLVVRPDDVWLAIVTQFSFFVNAHAEALRRVFVAHELPEKRALVVEAGADRYSVDAATSMVRRVTAFMDDHLTDSSLREWIMPSFTTTTAVDKTTCAVAMMGSTTKDQPAHKFTLRCGIPKVTLEGERKDWQTILQRLERLKQYGIQTIAWYHLLRPVLSRFVSAYDNPFHSDNLDFWNKIVHREAGGSDSAECLSGWITAFCVFDARGRWLGDTLNEDRVREHEPKKLLRPADPLQLTPSHFTAVYMVRERGAPCLSLDGFPYPMIESRDVPCGHVCLDVVLARDESEDADSRRRRDYGHDDGARAWSAMDSDSGSGSGSEAMLIAGSVGSQICSTEKTELFRNGMRDTVKPISAWWFLVGRGVGRRGGRDEGS